MDGAALAGELTADVQAPCRTGVRFVVASPEQDADLRRLLRESWMPGTISLSMEREPGFFAAAAIEGTEHQTLVGLRGQRVVCIGTISARQRFINGQPTRVGYLSGLRTDASLRGHASIMVRRGYELFHRLHQNGGPAIYLTSIVADNMRARRLLERGLPGMPTYRFLGEFVTLAIENRGRRVRRTSLRVINGSQELVPVILDLLNRDHRQYQFAPLISAADLCLPGLRLEDFRIALRSDGTPAACVALWDQSAARQTVVRGYSRSLRLLRPWMNSLSWLLSKPRLPAIGQRLAHAFLAHLAGDPQNAETIEELLETLMEPARTRGIDYLTIGFHARDPRLARLRKAFRPREYVSRLYAVHWEDGARLAQSLDDRLLAPEVALL